MCWAGIPVIYGHTKQSLEAEPLSSQEERETHELADHSKDTPVWKSVPRTRQEIDRLLPRSVCLCVCLRVPGSTKWETRAISMDTLLPWL